MTKDAARRSRRPAVLRGDDAVAALPGDGKEACDQPELEQRAPAAEIIGGHDAEDGSIASGSTT